MNNYVLTLSRYLKAFQSFLKTKATKNNILEQCMFQVFFELTLILLARIVCIYSACNPAY